MTAVSVEDMAVCAEREVAYRQRVYPRWVKLGRMTQAKADREIAAMQAIVDHLRAAAPADRDLFGQ